jgi:hypothetical protein
VSGKFVRAAVPVLALIALLRETAIAQGQFNANELLRTGAERVKNNTHALRRLSCEEQTAREFYLPAIGNRHARKLGG